MNTCPNCGHELPNDPQRKGGKKRWSGVSKEQRSEIGRKAVAKRWAKNLEETKPKIL